MAHERLQLPLICRVEGGDCRSPDSNTKGKIFKKLHASGIRKLNREDKVDGGGKGDCRISSGSIEAAMQTGKKRRADREGGNKSTKQITPEQAKRKNLNWERTVGMGKVEKNEQNK